MSEFILATIEKMDAAAVFVSGGVDPIIEAIELEVKSFEHDLSTDKGRKATASLSAKIAKAKVRLDDAGKGLVSDWKEQAKKVDVVRKDIRDRLDILKVEARKPLTEWEEEQEQIKIQKRIEAEKELERLKLEAEVKQAEIDAYEEDAFRTAQKLQAEQQAELDRQREAFEAEKAELEAAKQKLIDDENARLAAEKLKEQIAEDNLRAEEQRERNRLAEIERKEQEEKRIEAARLQAIETEKSRVAAEEEQKRRDQAKREENKKIVARTHNTIEHELTRFGISKEAAKAVVELIADGKIPKVSITY